LQRKRSPFHRRWLAGPSTASQRASSVVRCVLPKWRNQAIAHYDASSRLIDQPEPFLDPVDAIREAIKRMLHAGYRRHQEGKHVFHGRPSRPHLAHIIAQGRDVGADDGQILNYEVAGFVGHWRPVPSSIFRIWHGTGGRAMRSPSSYLSRERGDEC
jgi:hypothetical protein